MSPISEWATGMAIGTHNRSAKPALDFSLGVESDDRVAQPPSKQCCVQRQMYPVPRGLNQHLTAKFTDFNHLWWTPKAGQAADRFLPIGFPLIPPVIPIIVLPNWG